MGQQVGAGLNNTVVISECDHFLNAVHIAFNEYPLCTEDKPVFEPATSIKLKTLFSPIRLMFCLAIIALLGMMLSSVDLEMQPYQDNGMVYNTEMTTNMIGSEVVNLGEVVNLQKRAPRFFDYLS